MPPATRSAPTGHAWPRSRGSRQLGGGTTSGIVRQPRAGARRSWANLEASKKNGLASIQFTWRPAPGSAIAVVRPTGASGDITDIATFATGWELGSRAQRSRHGLPVGLPRTPATCSGSSATRHHHHGLRRRISRGDDQHQRQRPQLRRRLPTRVDRSKHHHGNRAETLQQPPAWFSSTAR